jgi:hypothetical protein
VPAGLTVTGPCPAISDRMTEALGGFDCSGNAFVSFRNPFGLSNWTMPVLELTFVAGAVLAVVHVLRCRRRGDPVPLVLILASLVYLLVVEPVLYFPNKAGLSDSWVLFVHNAFTVTFFHDRLPLYIVGLYLVLPLLAFEIVRALDVFGRRGALVGAICVGAVHCCFYEVFDQLGPQLRWWAWNTAAAANHPLFASVPLASVVLFAAFAPAGLAYAVYRLVGAKVRRGEPIGRFGYFWRTVAAGGLTPFAMVLGSVPVSPFGGADPNVTAQAVVLSAELGLIWLVAVPALASSWRETRREQVAGDRPGLVVWLWAPVFLLVMAVFWATAVPAFSAAAGGLTADHTPIGNLPFAAACFAAALVWLWWAGRRIEEAP